MKAGLFPFNPDRVLRDIPKPLAELTVPKADDVKVGSLPQDDILQTPVTAETLTLLRSQLEQDAHALDESSKQRLQKLANAAQVSFAERALLRDENQLLFKQNDEAKRRRSTKSTVLGKAKVMSYEDIEEARGKCAAKEAAKEAAASGKRGRQHKGPAPAEATAKRARRSEVEVAEDQVAAAGLRDHCSVLRFQ